MPVHIRYWANLHATTCLCWGSLRGGLRLALHPLRHVWAVERQFRRDLGQGLHLRAVTAKGVGPRQGRQDGVGFHDVEPFQRHDHPAVTQPQAVPRKRALL